MRDAQKLEAAQMGILRPLLDLTRLDRQRNPDIRNGSEGDNTVEDTQLYQKKWLYQLERMGTSRLLKLVFQYQPRGRRYMGRPKRRWTHEEHLKFQRNNF
jgi:hypothetical protein